MTTRTNVGAHTHPSANITISKSRLKVDNNKVYLKDGDEFEIELFNPTQDNIAAELWMNGTKKGETLLVLKPGQRCFLERYLDTNKRFKFETYDVDKGNDQVEAAIAKNGLLEIKFYREQPLVKTRIATTSAYPFNQFNGWNNVLYKGSNTGGWAGTVGSAGPNGLNDNNTLKCSGSFGASQNNMFYCSSNITSNDIVGSTITTTMDWMSKDLGRSFGDLSDEKQPEQKETGRVGEGSVSQQTFDTIDMNFATYPFYTESVQILPLSEKPVITEDEIKVYCTGCGMKQRNNWKFCPKCGTKFE